MVDNTLVHFKTKENFKREKGNIQDTSIAFIKDSKQISTHDTIYNFVNWNVLDGNIVEVPSIYEFVDLGLPSGILWADRNVGAESPENYGLYFAWGETQGYEGMTDTKKFYWGDYKFSSGQNADDPNFRNSLIKYNTDSTKGSVVDNLTTLLLEDDAAYITDNTCKMPTINDINELVENTTSRWETLNGVSGRRFTSKKNSNSVFIPASGYYSNGTFLAKNVYCCLWSSTLQTNPSGVHILNFNSSSVQIYGFDRKNGGSVRPVKK